LHYLLSYSTTSLSAFLNKDSLLNMKYNTTPAENTSHFSEYPYSLSTSGAMNPGVPDNV
jgi:hypothetical protein